MADTAPAGLVEASNSHTFLPPSITVSTAGTPVSRYPASGPYVLKSRRAMRMRKNLARHHQLAPMQAARRTMCSARAVRLCPHVRTATGPLPVLKASDDGRWRYARNTCPAARPHDARPSHHQGRPAGARIIIEHIRRMNKGKLLPIIRIVAVRHGKHKLRNRFQHIAGPIGSRADLELHAHTPSMKLNIGTSCTCPKPTVSLSP